MNTNTNNNQQPTQTNDDPSTWDIFSILNCTIPNPTLLDLKQSFNNQAKLLHPDKNTDPNANIQFNQLHQAWKWIQIGDNLDQYRRRQFEKQQQLQQQQQQQQRQREQHTQRYTQQQYQSSFQQNQLNNQQQYHNNMNIKSTNTNDINEQKRQMAIQQTNIYINQLRNEYLTPAIRNQLQLNKQQQNSIDLTGNTNNNNNTTLTPVQRETAVYVKCYIQQHTIGSTLSMHGGTIEHVKQSLSKKFGPIRHIYPIDKPLASSYGTIDLTTMNDGVNNTNKIENVFAMYIVIFQTTLARDTALKIGRDNEYYIFPMKDFDLDQQQYKLTFKNNPNATSTMNQSFTNHRSSTTINKGEGHQIEQQPLFPTLDQNSTIFKPHFTPIQTPPNNNSNQENQLSLTNHDQLYQHYATFTSDDFQHHYSNSTSNNNNNNIIIPNNQQRDYAMKVIDCYQQKTLRQLPINDLTQNYMIYSLQQQQQLQQQHQQQQLNNNNNQQHSTIQTGDESCIIIL